MFRISRVLRRGIFVELFVEFSADDLLGVANLGRFEVEDYGGVVEVQSEHLTYEVTDDLAQSLPIWIPPCLDASACCNQSPWRRDIRSPRLETLLTLRVQRKTPRKRPSRLCQ